MPTLQEKEALRSRMATFLAMLLTFARVKRTVLIASGASVTNNTRNVVNCVNGASTRCDSVEGIVWLILF